MSRAERIEAILTETLKPSRVSVTDESRRHEGHAGWRPSGETHYHVEVVSTAFEGKGRVERQRLVYGLLGQEFTGGLHALSLKTLTPAEDGATA